MLEQSGKSLAGSLSELAIIFATRPHQVEQSWLLEDFFCRFGCELLT